MLIDLHVHTKEFSSCSKVSFAEIIEAAKAKGLAGICITDHDNYGAKDLIAKHQEDNFTIILGIEVLTNQGDILVFGAYDIPEDTIDAAELVSLVNDQGGVTIAAHPYRANNRGVGDHINSLPGLTGVEILNGNTVKENNLRALAAAQNNDKVLIAASDAHLASQVGKYATKFSTKIENVDDLVNAIKCNYVTPMVYCQTDNKFYKMEEVYEKV